MPRNMKEFVARVEESHPEEMIRVDGGPLRPHLGEPTSILCQFETQGKFPMGVFTNIQTYSGKRFGGSVQVQADGTFSKLMIAMDLPKERWAPGVYFDDLLERLRQPIPPVVIPAAQAPVKYEIVDEAKCNLWDLPIYIKDEYDARPGWLCGVIVGKHPSSGRYNLSWHRLMAIGERRGPSRIQYRHLWGYMKEYKEAGHKRMPMAWVFGHHPMFMQAAAVKTSWSIDEYAGAGGFLREPLRLTASRTWGDAFLIPADAEAVVEGWLDLYDFDVNGPWGDFMRYYSPQTPEPVFSPTAFNLARDCIFDDHNARHDLYGTTGRSLSFYGVIKERYPRVRAAYNVAPHVAIIQYHPDHPGEARRLALLALASAGDTLKQVIVVDEDINPFNLHDVLFSLGTRVDGNTEQVQVIRGLDANRHDPSSFDYMNVGGFIIDSTRPAGVPFPEFSFPSRKMMDEVPLDKFLSPDQQTRVRGGLALDIHPTIN